MYRSRSAPARCTDLGPHLLPDPPMRMAWAPLSPVPDAADLLGEPMTRSRSRSDGSAVQGCCWRWSSKDFRLLGGEDDVVTGVIIGGGSGSDRSVGAAAAAIRATACWEGGRCWQLSCPPAVAISSRGSPWAAACCRADSSRASASATASDIGEMGRPSGPTQDRDAAPPAALGFPGGPPVEAPEISRARGASARMRRPPYYAPPFPLSPKPPD